MQDVSTLEEYLNRYGPLLGLQAKNSLDPLYDPEQHPQHPGMGTLLRKPYAPQAACITAGVEALKRQKSLLLVGECGTGKTIMGQSIAHLHAGGRPYRGLVFAPGQLVKKWKRELEETLPSVHVTIWGKWRDVLDTWADRTPPTKPQWFVIGRDTAKLGAKWEPAAVLRPGSDKLAYCPDCFAPIVKRTKEGDEDSPIDPGKLGKKKHWCDVCGAPLWRYNRDIDRWEPAKFVHKHMRGFFDYLIVDEVHEEKSATSAQANAMGSLAAAARKVIGMTGTLIGGYADHLRPTLWRLCPRTLVDEGFSWRDVTAFNERYGRMEVRITEKESGGDNSMSRGSSTSKTKYCRPGIMPTLFGRHLIGSSIFLGLDEMGGELPPLTEHVVGVPMDMDLATAYETLEEALKKKIREMVAKRDKRLLSTMLVTLLSYPDHPFGWQGVGYKDDNGTFHEVTRPRNLGRERSYAKEKTLVDLCRKEYALGRQVWVYVVFNGKRDVESRVAEKLRRAGLRVGVLKASVPLKEREEWIAERGRDCDVVLSHPRLVETGLDLFDKGTLAHNFSTLIFYETGFQLSTLRQASRRAWRLMQPKPCHVYYLWYEGTMQERAMSLMGKKLAAAEALEGKFSSEGLVALSGDDGLEVAMAKSLVDNLDEQADRTWKDVAERSEAPQLELTEIV